MDTNLFVSSLLVKSGLPAQALDAWRQRKCLLVTSPSLIAEIVNTLNYPHIRHKYPITDEHIIKLVTLLEQDALVVPGTANVSGVIPADPDDEMILACALDGQADFIASGDRHLLELREYQGIPIITAREFLNRLSENTS
ncbi:MAG TPA: putative toxin-antitoxin system toxin component, PIN family [Chloroflexota bacterium]|nr:putative toxin-antitoxin system toxin component, PIN family [Chloroflexota bacterium]HUM69244.1 putative toxin-antitoxin system toxin component, PIN family [Chloroflexota bacterium]